MNVNKYDTLNVTVMNSAENLTLNTLESKTLWMNESVENSTVFYDYYGDQNSAYIFYKQNIPQRRLGEKRKYASVKKYTQINMQIYSSFSLLNSIEHRSTESVEFVEYCI